MWHGERVRDDEDWILSADASNNFSAKCSIARPTATGTDATIRPISSSFCITFFTRVLND